MLGNEAVCAAAMPAVIKSASDKKAIRVFAVSKVVDLSVGIL